METPYPIKPGDAVRLISDPGYHFLKKGNVYTVVRASETHLWVDGVEFGFDVRHFRRIFRDPAGQAVADERRQELLERFRNAVAALPAIAERMAKGQQFNEWERASNDEDGDPDDWEYLIGIGPVGDLFAFETVEGQRKADLIAAALKLAAHAITHPAPVQPAVADIVPEGCTGSAFAFEPGVLHVNKEGSGYIAIGEDDFELEDDRWAGPDGLEGSVHWITRLPASEMQALRDFLNGVKAPRAVQPAGDAMAETLEPFVSFAKHSVEKQDDGWAWRTSGNERICDWFGPSDFGAALLASRHLPARVCAKEGCERSATVHFERGGVGSDYCHDCYMRVQAIAARNGEDGRG